MNKYIKNAMRIRETAMATSFIRGLDICEGDIVQIRGPGHHAGRVGMVIGASYYQSRGDIRFTVKFSDNKAALFSGERLELVRGSEKHKLKLLQSRLGTNDDSKGIFGRAETSI